MDSNKLLTETLILLNQTFTEKDQTIRENAEKRLKELGKFNLNYLKKMIFYYISKFY